MPEAAPRSALLVMDIQPGIIDRIADPAVFLARVTDAVRAARSKGRALTGKVFFGKPR